MKTWIVRFAKEAVAGTVAIAPNAEARASSSADIWRRSISGFTMM
jgi:hypothetical protein